MTTSSVLIAAAIALAPGLAWADPAATAPKPPVAVAAPSADRLLCKKEETTGTRLGARQICYTRDDWVKVNAYARDAVNHAQQQQVAPYGH